MITSLSANESKIEYAWIFILVKYLLGGVFK